MVDSNDMVVEELFECPVCFESDKELRLFNCQHFACTECVDELAARSNPFACPECRADIRAPVAVYRLAEQLRERNRDTVVRREFRVEPTAPPAEDEEQQGILNRVKMAFGRINQFGRRIVIVIAVVIPIIVVVFVAVSIAVVYSKTDS